MTLTPSMGKPVQDPTSPTPGAVPAPAGQHSRSDVELFSSGEEPTHSRFDSCPASREVETGCCLVGYSAIEKILLCLSEVNERNFELFLACNTYTCTPNFYTRCVQLSSYTQIASDVMGVGFAAPALHFGPDFTERNCISAFFRSI